MTKKIILACAACALTMSLGVAFCVYGLNLRLGSYGRLATHMLVSDAPEEPAVIQKIKADLEQPFASGDDYAIVSAVREWVYAHVDRAAGAEELLDWSGVDLDEVFARMENGEGGFYCAGAAMILTMVYEALGYHALYYGMGIAGGSHAVTLVDIDVAGDRVWSIQDAYLDYSIERNGAPADFVEMYRALDAGRDEGFVAASPRRNCKPILALNPGIRAYVETFYGVSDMDGPSEIPRFCHDFWLDEFLNNDPMGVGMLDYFEQIGLPRNILYWFAYPLGLTKADIFALANS